MSKLLDIETARDNVLLRRADINLKDSLSCIKSTISFLENNNLIDSVKYPELYQKYLDWLDELNKISVRN